MDSVYLICVNEDCKKYRKPIKKVSDKHRLCNMCVKELENSRKRLLEFSNNENIVTKYFKIS